jgi:hypothetical protein
VGRVHGGLRGDDICISHGAALHPLLAACCSLQLQYSYDHTGDPGVIIRTVLHWRAAHLLQLPDAALLAFSLLAAVLLLF